MLPDGFGAGEFDNNFFLFVCLFFFKKKTLNNLAIFCSFENSTDWTFAGFISNEKPSGIFRLSRRGLPPLFTDSGPNGAPPKAIIGFVETRNSYSSIVIKFFFVFVV